MYIQMYIAKACHILDAARRDNSLRRLFDRDYRLYSRIISIVFFLNTVYPVGLKLFQDRLAGDWLHSVLHLASGLFGA